MSEASVSIAEIKEEFLETIGEANRIVTNSRNRSLEITQLKIMLKQKMNQISGVYNKLVQNFVITDPELVWSLISDVSFELQVFTSKLSKDPLLEEIYLSAKSIANFVITMLAMIRVPTNKYRAYGVASFLMKLLSDENNIAELPADLSIDNMAEMGRRNAWFNALNSAANMYTALAPGLPAISLEMYVQIANRAFYYVSKVKELSDLKHNEKLLQYALNNNRNPYEYLSISFAWVTSAMNIIFDASMKFGRNWPDEISTSGLLKSNSSDEYVEFIKEAVMQLRKAFAYMDEIYTNGKVNKNFGDPKQVPTLGIYRYFEDILAHGISRTYVFNKINRNIVNGIYQLEISELSNEEISDAIEDNRHSLKTTESLAPSPAQLLTSQFGQFYQVVFIDLIKLEVLKSVKLHSREDFDLLLLTHEEIFTEDIILATPEIWLVKILAEIFIDVYFENYEKMPDYLAELQKYQSAFELEPKHFITISSLIIIISHLVHDEVSEQNMELLQQSYELLRDANLNYLLDEYKQYADELMKYLNNEIPQQLFDRKIPISPFDAFSWLVPTFAKNQKNIKYLPFNLEYDQIIHNM